MLLTKHLLTFYRSTSSNSNITLEKYVLSKEKKSDDVTMFLLVRIPGSFQCDALKSFATNSEDKFVNNSFEMTTNALKNKNDLSTLFKELIDYKICSPFCCFQKSDEFIFMTGYTLEESADIKHYNIHSFYQRLVGLEIDPMNTEGMSICCCGVCCVVNTEDGIRLKIDDLSGTYRPEKSHTNFVKKVMNQQLNDYGLKVETYNYSDEYTDWYKMIVENNLKHFDFRPIKNHPIYSVNRDGIITHKYGEYDFDKRPDPPPNDDYRVMKKFKNNGLLSEMDSDVVFCFPAYSDKINPVFNTTPTVLGDIGNKSTGIVDVYAYLTESNQFVLLQIQKTQKTLAQPFEKLLNNKLKTIKGVSQFSYMFNQIYYPGNVFQPSEFVVNAYNHHIPSFVFYESDTKSAYPERQQNITKINHE